MSVPWLSACDGVGLLSTWGVAAQRGLLQLGRLHSHGACLAHVPLLCRA